MIIAWGLVVRVLAASTGDDRKDRFHNHGMVLEIAGDYWPMDRIPPLALGAIILPLGAMFC